MSSTSSTKPVAEVVATLLVEAGVRRIYTVPGESFLPLIEAFESHPHLTVVSTRHESGAGFMAEADGKLSGAPAAVMATRGVGAANLSIALHTARQDSTPMIALLGQVETEHLGKEAFQEVDLPGFLREVTVSAETASRSDLVPTLVARALARATTGRPGPAAVALPADVLEGSVAPHPSLLGRRGAPVAAPGDVDAVATLLQQANRPVVIAGQGTDPQLLVELAGRYGVGVYAAFRRQDCFPNDDEHYLGHLTLGTPHPLLEPLEAADLVLVLGERLDEVTTQGYRYPTEHSRVVHVHPDPAVLGRHCRADLALVADPADLSRRLAAGDAPTADGDPWWRDGHEAYQAIAAQSAGQPGGGLHPGRAVEAVQGVAPPGTVVVNDAGNFSVYLHRQWRFTEPRTQAAPISGAMGYAVPGAVGAALARPDRTVLGVAGDGGFLMTAHELETAARLGVNTKMLVLQNGLYGTIAMHQARGGLPVRACDISQADLAGLSRALGVRALTCDQEEQLGDAAAELFSHQGPAVLVVRTDPDQLVPGTSLSRLRGQGA